MPSIVDARSLTKVTSNHRSTSLSEDDLWEDLTHMKMAVEAAQVVLRKCGENNMFLNVHYSSSTTSRKIAVKTPPFSTGKYAARKLSNEGLATTTPVKPTTSVVLLTSSACTKAASEIRQWVYERFYRTEGQGGATSPGDDLDAVIIITRRHLEAMLNKHTNSFVRTYYYDKLAELRRSTQLMCLMDTRLQKDPVDDKVMTMVTQMFVAPPYVLDINCKDFTFKVISGCLGHDMWLYPWREASFSSAEISSMKSHARAEYLHIRNFIKDYEAQKVRTAAVDSEGNCYLLQNRKGLPIEFSVAVLHLHGGKVENCFVGSAGEPSDVIVKRISLIGRVLRLVCPDFIVSAFTVGGILAPQVPLSREGLELLKTSVPELPMLDGRTHPVSSIDAKNKRSKVKR